MIQKEIVNNTSPINTTELSIKHRIKINHSKN